MGLAVVRYTVKVTEEHLASLQLSTSKSDVYVKLQVLDGEEELGSAVGKGHVVLPAITFQKDPGTEDGGEAKRSSSRACECHNHGLHGQSHFQKTILS